VLVDEKVAILGQDQSVKSGRIPRHSADKHRELTVMDPGLADSNAVKVPKQMLMRRSAARLAFNEPVTCERRDEKSLGKWR
jgi:hypothetical protein